MTRALLFVALALPAAAQNPPTAAEAKAFMDKVEARLFDMSHEAGRASWVQATYITDDTEALAAIASQRQIDQTVEFAKQATRFDKVQLPPELDRKFKLLKLSLTLATPAGPKEAAELTRIATGMESAYGKGKYCPGGQAEKCLGSRL